MYRLYQTEISRDINIGSDIIISQKISGKDSRCKDPVEVSKEELLPRNVLSKDKKQV